MAHLRWGLSFVARSVVAAVLAGALALVFARRDALERWLDAPTRKPRVEPPSEDPEGPTRADLYKEAQRLEIAGRSRMSKSELEAAVRGWDLDQLATPIA